MKELIVPAEIERLYEVQAFVEGLMEESGLSMRMINRVSLVVEEIYVNIAGNAYFPGEGDVVIRCTIGDDHSLELEFEDQGKPYDPLEEAKPDINLSAEEREIGGLGIFLYRSIMDETEYRFENGKNILTLRKKEE